jgi:general secretion pathway protein D
MRLIIVSLLLSIFSLSLSANCENKYFSFSIKESKAQNISIIDVIENISDECKMTVVFEDSSVKKVIDKKLNYINVKDYSLKELLELLLSYNNLFYTLSNNNKVLKISYIKTKSYFIDYVSFTQRKSTTNKVIKTGSSSSGGEDSTTMDFSSDFQFWNKIEAEINDILNRNSDGSLSAGKVLVNQDAGMVTISGTKKQLSRVEKYIKRIMKRLHKEILIEAKIIEVKYSDDKTTGVDWSKFELSINGSSDASSSAINGVYSNGFKEPNYLVGYNFSIEGLISFLKTQGDVKIVSNPKVMTLNNQSAVINVGEELNYRYQTDSVIDANGNVSVSYDTGSTFVGVTLDITPQVTEDNYIMLKINPIVSEISSLNADADGVPYLAPNIKIKQLSSIVKVKDGNKVLIGGLISKSKEVTNTSVPLLSSIPFLGGAFKSDTNIITNSEMIIVLIPRIVNGKHNPTLDDIDEKYSEEEK